MLQVTKEKLVGHGDMVLGQRTPMIAQCEARKMSADQRRCLMAATDLSMLAACRTGKVQPQDEKPRNPRPVTPPAEAPPPATAPTTPPAH